MRIGAALCAIFHFLWIDFSSPEHKKVVGLFILFF